MDIPEEAHLKHYGVKGMHWGITKNPDTGVRPIAKTLNDSVLGRAANSRANSAMRKQTANSNRRKELGRDPRSIGERFIHRLRGLSLEDVQRNNRAYARRTNRENRAADLNG